jgi:hypothetical protein
MRKYKYQGTLTEVQHSIQLTLYKLKMLLIYFLNKATLMRRSTVLSRPLQLDLPHNYCANVTTPCVNLI